MPAYADVPICEEKATPQGQRNGPRQECHSRMRPSDRRAVRACSPLPPRRDWTALPKATAILADCAANPPASRTIRVADLTTYHARQYVGARVRRLRAIHRAEADRIFALCDAARNYEAFDAHCRLNVQQAIADALFHAAIARSAACDARALQSRS
jgi:hypothetical protein